MFTEHPGTTDVLEHRIDTGTARPWRCNPRPLSARKRDLLDAALDEMIATGAVRRSQSPWAFPVVLAPKKDGTARLCVDYRQLNAVTVRDAYPFPSIESIMYALGNASVFTILDCSRGFLQIPVGEEDIQKTAFTCHRGLFEFTRLPFGLSNSPASFQRLMDVVLDDAKFNYAMAYMDDVVVFSKSFDEHLVHLGNVLSRMRDAGLTINPGKVQLASPKVDLLGFVVDLGTLSPNEDKLRAILEYPRPHDVKSLQRFLGMVGFYRQFIPHCASLAKPLYELLRKNSQWAWGPRQEEAFRSLSQAIADTAKLWLPDLNKPFVMQTDASDYGLGAVLLQEHDGGLCPVGFASRTLSPAEMNYSVTEKECLAVMFGLKKFDMYLDGTTFTIQTDHQALSWLQRLKKPSGRLARWALALQGYSYHVEYLKGNANKVADALSRAPLGYSCELQQEPQCQGRSSTGCVGDLNLVRAARRGRSSLPAEERGGEIGCACDYANLPEGVERQTEEGDLVAAIGLNRAGNSLSCGTIVSREELLEAQKSDGLCQRVSEKLADNSAADTGNAGRDDDGCLDSYLLSEDGLLLRYVPGLDEEDESVSPFKVVVPRKLRRVFMRYFHDSALAGHGSGSKTFHKLCRVATWPGMRQDVMRFTRSCPVCQKAKPRGGKPPGFMQPVVSSYPWHIVACDVMGPFPRSPRGNQYLLVVTDHFSKWVELFPLRKLVSERIWDRLMETFSRFGFPAQLITDNASYFTGRVFVDSCAALGIQHKRTTPYHPQANITERVNRNLKHMLVALTDRHKDWDVRLTELGFATRTTVNRSTGFSPAYLNFGKEVAFPLENGLRQCTEPIARNLSRYASELRSRLSDAVNSARESLDAARSEQARQYDKGHRPLSYEVGDLVLKRTHPLSNAAIGFAASLAQRWEGPFRVISRLSRLSYRLRRVNTAEETGPVHVGDLKRYHERDHAADEGDESIRPPNQLQGDQGGFSPRTPNPRHATPNAVVRDRSATRSTRLPRRGSRTAPSAGPTPRATPSHHSVATWTVQVGEEPVCFVSSRRWRDQPRPLRGGASETVAATFRGHLLSDRHPSEPPAVYTEEETARLCGTCGGLVIHRTTHELGDRHRTALATRTPAVPDAPPAPSAEDAVAAALRILREFRPELLLEAGSPPRGTATAGDLPTAGVTLNPVPPSDQAPKSTAAFDQELMDFLGSNPPSGP
ncbi:uncharacterized protein LOC135384605 [Ornithodoros turicata]|uniref:uncharacterized protein LOC135384605 n=1 Tax=Ornithodoros turicata TaxID=34597 RepID=UPI00313A00AF